MLEQLLGVAMQRSVNLQQLTSTSCMAGPSASSVACCIPQVWCCAHMIYSWETLVRVGPSSERAQIAGDSLISVQLR